MNQFKILLAVLLCFIISGTAVAVEDFGEEKIKAGVLVGRPLFFTAAFPVGKIMEIDVFAGFDYAVGYSYSTDSASYVAYPLGGVYFGIDYLFNVIDINIQDEIFPLSIGPRIAGSVGFLGGAALDIFLMVRFEYTFSKHAPGLNLYAELGPGARIPLIKRVGYTDSVFITGSGGIGIRYAFPR